MPDTPAAPTQQPLILSQAEVQSVLDPGQLLDRLADAFRTVSAGGASIPPRVGVAAPEGRLLVMPGYVPGVALGSKQVAIYEGNHERGLPSHLAVISLFDEATGALVCLLDGTYITTARTAGASALSARLLARTEASVLAILGAGVQGAAHLAAMTRVRDVTEIRVASRSLASAERLAATDSRARAVAGFEEAVRGADLICCCTTTDTPVVDVSWLRPGAHVTAIATTGAELDRGTVTQGHLFVETRAAFNPPPAGCAELAGLDPVLGTELGEVVAGSAPGRRSEEEITVYRSMGHAAEDLAAARLAYDVALAQGVGTRLGL